MYYYSNLFADLAARARSGDLEAQQQFRQELEKALVLMVRQTLHNGKDITSIARRILAVARRLTAEDSAAPFDTEDFVREVARNVCDEVVAHLQPAGGPVGDSIGHARNGATLLMS